MSTHKKKKNAFSSMADDDPFLQMLAYSKKILHKNSKSNLHINEPESHKQNDDIKAVTFGGEVIEDDKNSDDSELFGNLSETMSNQDVEESWKNKEYYRLPENVRNAIDIAKMKSPHSEFWYKL